MRYAALIGTAVIAVSVLGYARYIRAPEPGADIRIPKQVFAKSQSRICAYDATDQSGCEIGE